MGVIVLTMKRMVKKCFDGEVAMPKVNFWMIGLICLLTGIVCGLLAAPLTHGVIIGSNSGNVSDSNNVNDSNNGAQTAKGRSNKKK